MRNTISNKQYKKYDKMSRYNSFPIYYNNTDSKYFHGITAHLKKDNVKFITHKIMQGDNLDSLALYYYNNPLYYWVIADFNNINDPYKSLNVGSIINIPTFSSIEYDL